MKRNILGIENIHGKIFYGKIIGNMNRKYSWYTCVSFRLGNF